MPASRILAARSGVSLIPDGLEQAMTRQEMADLVAYLKADVK